MKETLKELLGVGFMTLLFTVGLALVMKQMTEEFQMLIFAQILMGIIYLFVTVLANLIVQLKDDIRHEDRMRHLRERKSGLLH